MADVDHGAADILAVEKAAKQLADRAAGRVDRDHIRAQAPDHGSDVDASAAGPRRTDVDRSLCRGTTRSTDAAMSIAGLTGQRDNLGTGRSIIQRNVRLSRDPAFQALVDERIEVVLVAARYGQAARQGELETGVVAVLVGGHAAAAGNAEDCLCIVSLCGAWGRFPRRRGDSHDRNQVRVPHGALPPGLLARSFAWDLPWSGWRTALIGR